MMPRAATPGASTSRPPSPTWKDAHARYYPECTGLHLVSGQTTGWVLRHGPASRAQRAVLVTIADAANRDGEYAHPGVRGMVEGSGYSRATVMAALRELVADGWIEVTDNGGGGRGLATVYRVCTERSNPPETVQSSDPFSDVNGPVHEAKGSNPRAERVQSSDSSPYPPAVTTPTSSSNVLSLPLQPVRDEVEQVFDSWIESLGPEAGARTLDSKRRRLIGERLKVFPLDTLMQAVRGWQFSSWHCGENDRHRAYNDLGLLLRDADHIEFFAELARNGPPEIRRAPVLPRGSDFAHEYAKRLAASNPDLKELQ